MLEEKKTFGELLKAARLRAGLQTQAEFANELSTYDLVYDDAAIGHWENNRRKPKTRQQMLTILRLLVDKRGLTELAEINTILAAAALRDVTAEEQAEYFSLLDYTSKLPYLPRKQYVRLVGREQRIEELVTLLTDPHGLSVVAITGLGGIGKTALAYEVVLHLTRDNHFQQVLWESAKSEEFLGSGIRTHNSQQVNWQTLLVSYANQLNIPSTQPFPQLEKQIKSRLLQGGYLVVLDNLETVEAAVEVTIKLHELVSPMSGASPSKVLITSRQRLVEQPHVHDYFIRGLEEPAALELLHVEAQKRGAKLLVENTALNQRIYKTTGGMPLALILMVSQYLLGISLERELDRIEGTTDEEEIYRFIYFAIWEKITLGAQKVLVGAATFGTSAQRPHLMHVSEMPEESLFDKAIAELIRLSLIEVLYLNIHKLRYDIHSMTRSFVNGPLADLWKQQRNSGG